MINNLFIVGNGRSGKSTVAKIASWWFSEQNIRCKLFSDRQLLESAVSLDTSVGRSDGDGWKIGFHSKSRLVGENFQMHILDGSLLNQVHADMLDLAAFRHDGQLYIFEYATGPDIPFPRGEPLRQHGDHLVRGINKKRVGRVSYVLEMRANLGVRQLRNQLSNDAMADETFTAYFPDGGEIDQMMARQLLGTNIRVVDNDAQDAGFEARIRQILDWHLLPLLHQEGNPRRRR